MNQEKIDLLKETFKEAWSRDTAYPACQKNWSKNNPAHGQCAVTAMIVQDLCGGEICKITLEKFTHYFNVIKGEVIDFTEDQFKVNNQKISYDDREQVIRDYCSRNKDTMKRYYILKDRVEKILSLK